MFCSSIYEGICTWMENEVEKILNRYGWILFNIFIFFSLQIVRENSKHNLKGQSKLGNEYFPLLFGMKCLLYCLVNLWKLLLIMLIMVSFSPSHLQANCLILSRKMLTTNSWRALWAKKISLQWNVCKYLCNCIKLCKAYINLCKKCALITIHWAVISSAVLSMPKLHSCLDNGSSSIVQNNLETLADWFFLYFVLFPNLVVK